MQRSFVTIFQKYAKTLACVFLTVHMGACTEDFDDINPPLENYDETVAQLILDEQNIIAEQPTLIRSLTEGEKAFYYEFYDGDLDIDDIRIFYYEEDHPVLSANVIEGDDSIIRVYGEKNYSDDYTKESGGFKFGLLAYEIEHLHQHQTSSHKNEHDLSTSSNYETLYGHAQLDEYSDAQQRSIIADYTRFIFSDDGYTSQLVRYGEGNCNAQHILTETVERAHPDARNMREEHQTRSLTDNEKALILGIFGNKITNTDDMTIQLRARCKGDAAATVYGGEKTHFHAWTRDNHADDYTTSDLFDFGVLVHEAAHFWQNQTERLYTVGHNKTYEYNVDANNLDFRDYYSEQQGAIIEDYARYFLQNERDTRYLEHTKENLEGLKTIVETEFPMAEKTRLYFERHNQLPSLDTVESWISNDGIYAMRFSLRIN